MIICFFYLYQLRIAAIIFLSFLTTPLYQVDKTKPNTPQLIVAIIKRKREANHVGQVATQAEYNYTPLHHQSNIAKKQIPPIIVGLCIQAYIFTKKNYSFSPVLSI